MRYLIDWLEEHGDLCERMSKENTDKPNFQMLNTALIKDAEAFHRVAAYCKGLFYASGSHSIDKSNYMSPDPNRITG
jgi:hypothetical protein